MNGQRPRHLFWIAGAFAAVALLFVVATAIVSVRFRSIDAEVTALRVDALPSFDHLLAAQSDLARLVLATGDLAEAPAAQRGERAGALFDIRAAFDKEITAYLSLGKDGEYQIYASEATPRMRALDGTLDRIRQEASSAAAVRRLQEQLYAEVESVDAVLRELMRLHASEAWLATERIAGIRRASTRLAAVLDAGSAVLAAIAAAIALRAAWKYAATKEHDAQLLADRASELEMFDQRVAHDLLSPMSTVSLSMVALARKHSDADTQELVQRATRALQRSGEIVEGILAFARSGARPSAGARSELGRALQTAGESIVSAEGVSPPEIRIEPFDDVAVACDSAVLVTMLTNLLSNAEKYTRNAPVRRVTVRPLVSQDRVRVEVQDTGPGIPPGMEKSLFELYVRGPDAAQPGIGLGLATVKRFATAYGGTVGVRSLEQGSAFWFELPRAEPSEAAARSKPELPRWAFWRRARQT
jgi:signal transduction histidine kinase